MPLLQAAATVGSLPLISCGAGFVVVATACTALQRLSASNPTVKVPPDCADEHLSATCAKLRDSHAAHPALRLPGSCEPYLDGS